MSVHSMKDKAVEKYLDEMGARMDERFDNVNIVRKMLYDNVDTMLKVMPAKKVRLNFLRIMNAMGVHAQSEVLYKKLVEAEEKASS